MKRFVPYSSPLSLISLAALGATLLGASPRADAQKGEAPVVAKAARGGADAQVQGGADAAVRTTPSVDGPGFAVTLPVAPSTTLLAAAAEPTPGSLAESASLAGADPTPQHKPLDPSDAAAVTPNNKPVAPRYTKYIPAGWVAQPVHGREKLILGARDLYSPANFAAIFVSAGYSHVTNGQPNFGTDKGAFGQRLGAAAIRETAQGILTDGVFSVVFHQDPRYYDEGDSFSLVHRTVYAITRPLITRTNAGRQTLNVSLLSGYAATAVLNNAYYPSSNRNVHDTLSGFGGSIGGAALGFFLTEFQDDILAAMHLKHKP